MNDEDYGVLLLQPLKAGNPDGPTRIDVAKAMGDGLRARRLRTWSTAMAVTAGMAAIVTAGMLVLTPPRHNDENLPQPVLPADVALPAACTVDTLPVGDATSAGVTGGDPSGTYLVGATEPVFEGDFDLLVWKDGKLVADVEYEGPRVEMKDINGVGEAVGSTNAGTIKPYAYRDGKVRPMKGVGTTIAINDAGMIAGDTEHVTEEPHPQRWSSWDAEPEAMPLPDGITGGAAYDITEDGTILTALFTGSYTSRASTRGAYLWHADGEIEAIGAPEMDIEQPVNVQPIAFRYGWVYAVAGTDEIQSLFRYDPVSKVWQKINDEPYSAQLPAGGPQALGPRPKVYIGKEMFELPTVEKYGDDSFMIESVSEDAQVIAGSNMSGVAADRPVVPIIWRCR
ncbi:hypothetical protein FB565_005056 [Actinoplanes lutulentus]|uniref:Uncharacterized protein n=1 Tax=Actinoplanes lutulentus TaxID=1287878 RepID=A0A327ZHC1_9ACTN|nr:hypothetical protein [Actinoplanes lutulentus]MBB2945323.1 hypothetical protein [Actinoplanes lutulentus]RAK40542.1 hypothetical protein B0I29_103580 [Actinoplanes lutulentus]